LNERLDALDARQGRQLEELRHAVDTSLSRSPPRTPLPTVLPHSDDDQQLDLVTTDTLLYLTIWVDRLLHLSSTEAVSVWPNAHLQKVTVTKGLVNGC